MMPVCPLISFLRSSRTGAPLAGDACNELVVELASATSGAASPSQDGKPPHPPSVPAAPSVVVPSRSRRHHHHSHHRCARHRRRAAPSRPRPADSAPPSSSSGADGPTTRRGPGISIPPCADQPSPIPLEDHLGAPNLSLPPLTPLGASSGATPLALSAQRTLPPPPPPLPPPPPPDGPVSALTISLRRDQHRTGAGGGTSGGGGGGGGGGPPLHTPSELSPLYEGGGGPFAFARPASVIVGSSPARRCSPSPARSRSRPSSTTTAPSASGESQESHSSSTSSSACSVCAALMGTSDTTVAAAGQAASAESGAGSDMRHRARSRHRRRPSERRGGATATVLKASSPRLYSTWSPYPPHNPTASHPLRPADFAPFYFISSDAPPASDDGFVSEQRITRRYQAATSPHRSRQASSQPLKERKAHREGDGMQTVAESAAVPLEAEVCHSPSLPLPA